MSRVGISRVLPAFTGDSTGTRAVLVNGARVGLVMPARSPGKRLRSWVVSLDSQPGNRFIGQSETLAGAIAIAQSWEHWPVQCWSYMSGDHGYMPDNSGCCTSRTGAVEGLVDLFELGNGRRARDLRRSGYVELGSRYGAQYASVDECSCPDCAKLEVGDADIWECPECSY